MSESSAPKVAPFTVTHRQRRLRQLTVIVLLFIGAMIVLGFTHPFFNLRPPAALSAPPGTVDSARLKVVRHAFAAKLLIVGIYWAFTFFLALLLPIFAWLYSREIRLQEAIARRDIWREVADRKPASPNPAGEPPAG